MKAARSAAFIYLGFAVRHKTQKGVAAQSAVTPFWVCPISHQKIAIIKMNKWYVALPHTTYSLGKD